MKSINVLLFVLLAISIKAQDLHIYYDVHNDSMWYMRNNEVIDEPIVKRGKQVYFHLVEFNNYIYHAKFKASQSTVPFGTHVPGNSLVKGLLSGLVSGFLPGAGLAMMNGNPLFGNILGLIPGAGGNAARGGIDELQEFESKLKELEIAVEEINSLTQEINIRKKSLTALNTTYEFTNALCANKNVAPSILKELLLKHCSEIFLKPATDNITLDEIPRLNSKLLEIPALEKNLQKKVGDYANNLNELKRQRQRLQQVDHGIDALYPLMKKLETTESQYESSIHLIATQIENQCAIPDPNAKSDYTSQIQQFYFKYHEIKDNSFSYTHHAEAEQKYLIYELDLFQQDSSQANPTVDKKSIKHIEVKVKTYGGTQFGMSVGLTGAKFNNAPQSYYLRNDHIFATDDDKYVPFITSLFNLSYDLGSYVSPAISLGFGIPITKSESIDNIAIFAGPGVYLGRKQAFMISGGTMFSKVNDLRNGFKVGDKINLGDGDIPTSKKYSLGYFLSLTYNISTM
jgi:hypothetical protein